MKGTADVRGRTFTQVLALLLVALLVLSAGCDEEDLASVSFPDFGREREAVGQPGDGSGRLEGSPETTEEPPPTAAPNPTETLPSAQGSEATQQPVVAVPEPLFYMTELINEARTAEGLAPVVWDPLAADVARQHARDMVERDYFGHRNLEGYGPDHRYALAGGEHAVQENLYAFVRVGEGRLPFESWADFIKTAHQELMDSPGGMVYDEKAGELRLAQEFTNHYVVLTEPLPSTLNPGDSFVLRGALGERAQEAGRVGNLLLSLAHEPFPEPMTPESVAAEATYVSHAEPLQTWRIEPTFERKITVDPALAPGLLHVRIFGDLPAGQALLMDRIIELRAD